MKRLIAALVAFAVPAAAAAYVHLAPLGGSLRPLDAFAEQLAAIRGQEAAVLALLALAVVLGLAVLFTGRKAPSPLLLDPAYETTAQDEDEAAPTPLPWAPGPEDARAEALSDARIAGLRRRALSESPPVPAGPAPVLLVRKPRERTRDWFADASWFGGLPRLGPAAWPRDEAGLPLPFAAQIDLGELAAACPDTPLPRTGALAFFLGTGAVVAVPESGEDFSEPPPGLPPAYDEGGYPLPARANRLSRWFFPFWPVEPVALAVRGDADDATIDQAASAYAPARDGPFAAAETQGLWWHAVIHLADQLHEALAGCDRPIAAQQEALARQHAALARLRIDPQAKPYAAEDAQEELAAMEATLETLREQCAALPDMVAALDGFVDGRDPWTPLTADERAIVADILAEIHQSYGELVREHVPATMAELATLSLRAMVSGPPEVLAALPDDVLARINRAYRLPLSGQHRLFGGADGNGEIVLLRLARDDLMEWNWAEPGHYAFTIGHDDAAAGNWHAARLDFIAD